MILKIQLIRKIITNVVLHFTNNYFTFISKASRHYAIWQTDNITNYYHLINTAAELAFSQTPLTKYSAYYQKIRS